MGNEARMLTDSDVDALAEKLINKVHEQKHDFWIEPEQHYIDHAALRALKPEDISSLQELVKAYRSARSLFWKSFLGFAIVGSVVLVGIGIANGVRH